MTVLLEPVAKSTLGSALQSRRTIANRETGKQSYVLCFEDGAQVIMPRIWWEIHSDEFPDGLYEGQMLAAYWEADENGTNVFHMYEVEEA